MPFRIVLAGGLVFVLAWFAVLRPSTETKPAVDPALVQKVVSGQVPTGTTGTAAQAKPAKPKTPLSGATAPGLKGLNNAIGAAKGAVATSEDAAAKSEAAAQAAATGGAAGSTAPSSTPAPSAGSAQAPSAASVATAPTAAPAKPPATSESVAVRADRSEAILAALTAGKTAVLLFSSSTASDDAHVRAALRHVDRRGGQVVVTTAPLAQVGDFEAITRGVQISQSPTLLVIGPDHRARALVGYTDTAEIDQLIGDTIRRG